jgi:hypothetical protein
MSKIRKVCQSNVILLDRAAKAAKAARSARLEANRVTANAAGAIAAGAPKREWTLPCAPTPPARTPSPPSNSKEIFYKDNRFAWSITNRKRRSCISGSEIASHIHGAIR